MKKLIFVPVAAALFAAAMPQAYASTLIGSQVTATAYDPDLSTPISYSDTATVGAGIEFPSGSILALPTFNGYIIGENIDVGADTITFTYTQDAQADSGAFNGFVLDFNASSPDILGVSVDPSSSFNIPLTFGPHQITENESGLYVTTADTIVLDVKLAPTTVNAAPEPKASALMLSGLGLIALSLWRRAARKQAGA